MNKKWKVKKKMEMKIQYIKPGVKILYRHISHDCSKDFRKSFFLIGFNKVLSGIVLIPHFSVHLCFHNISFTVLHFCSFILIQSVLIHSRCLI